MQKKNYLQKRDVGLSPISSNFTDVREKSISYKEIINEEI